MDASQAQTQTPFQAVPPMDLPRAADLPPSEARWLALFAHLGALVPFHLGIFSTLLCLLFSRGSGDYGEQQVREALRFQLSCLLLVLLSLPLYCFVLTIPFLLIGSLLFYLARAVLGIVAAFRTQAGDPWKYPIGFRRL